MTEVGNLAGNKAIKLPKPKLTRMSDSYLTLTL